ncbi:AP-1 complex subunit mu-2, partial [Tanacetum coccineum]
DATNFVPNKNGAEGEQSVVGVDVKEGLDTMAVSALFVLDIKGRCLISRYYRGDISSVEAERFFSKLLENETNYLMIDLLQEIIEAQGPVVIDNGVSHIFIRHNNVYVMAVSRQNCNVASLIAFLHHLASVFEYYCEELEEESLRDNFVVVTDAYKLEVTQRPPIAVTNAVSWRNEGIHYKKNEVFLDVIESINILVNSSRQIIRSEVVGALKMKTFLSGMPECKIGHNDRFMMDAQGRSPKGKSIDLEDIRFHQCVRLARFESDHTISCIPPDGPFDLMTYRLNIQNAITATSYSCCFKCRSHQQLNGAATSFGGGGSPFGGGSSRGRRQPRGEDVVHPLLTVSLEDLYNETSKKLFLTRSVLCSKCKGWSAFIKVITSAEFHPTNCSTLAYSSSKGSIRLIDLRQFALCDKHSKLFEEHDAPGLRSFFTEIIASISDIIGRIHVDGRFLTKVKGVFAIGDVIPGPMLAHKAEEDGIACVEFIAVKEGHVDYDKVHGVCYTHPEVASDGKTEEQVKELGIAYRAEKFPMLGNSRAKSIDDAEGLVKIIAEKETDKVLGIL